MTDEQLTSGEALFPRCGPGVAEGMGERSLRRLVCSRPRCLSVSQYYKPVRRIRDSC